MMLFENLIAITLYFAAPLFLLIVLLLLAGIWLRRRAGRLLFGAAGLLLLLLAAAWMVDGTVSPQLLPALLGCVRYDPNGTRPSGRLLPVTPETVLARQLDRLLGKTGDPPLRSDSRLTGYTFEQVTLDWGRWVEATVATRLEYADGSSQRVDLKIGTKGGDMLNWFGKEISRNAVHWYAPESSLARLIEPQPATRLQTSAAPFGLRKTAEIDALTLFPTTNPNASFARVVDLADDGRMLYTFDLRDGLQHSGSALVEVDATGAQTIRAEGHVIGDAEFGPLAADIAYTLLEPAERHVFIGSRQQPVASGDGQRVSWAGDQLIYRRNGRLLVQRPDREAQTIAELAPAELVAGNIFAVSPDGKHAVYSDIADRLWLQLLNAEQRHHVGWDVEQAEGVVWRPDGSGFAYVATNSLGLTRQDAVYYYDLESNTLRRLLQAGQSPKLREPCWLGDDGIVVSATPDFNRPVRLLYAAADGSGVWDMTPAELPYTTLACNADWIVVNSSRTTLTRYRVD